VNKFTIIPVTEIHDLQNVPVHVPRPRGNNTVWRWEDVFPSGNRTMGT
jgi:hypothetical protein